MNFILREKNVESNHTSEDLNTKFVFKLGEYDKNSALESVKKLTLEVSTTNQPIDDRLKWPVFFYFKCFQTLNTKRITPMHIIAILICIGENGMIKFRALAKKGKNTIINNAIARNTRIKLHCLHDEKKFMISDPC